MQKANERRECTVRVRIQDGEAFVVWSFDNCRSQLNARTKRARAPAYRAALAIVLRWYRKAFVPTDGSPHKRYMPWPQTGLP
jgi:hypothetical protein